MSNATIDKSGDVYLHLCNAKSVFLGIDMIASQEPSDQREAIIGAMCDAGRMLIEQAENVLCNAETSNQPGDTLDLQGPVNEQCDSFPKAAIIAG